MSVVLSEHLPLLASAPDGIQKLRGLILELAVRGKLVPQDPNDEPASELFKRIAAEKARREADGQIKKSNALSPMADDERSFPLPEGWAWARLAEVTQVLNGRAYSKHELLDAGTPVLRVGNLFTSNQWYYSNLTLEPDKYCDAGDLIFSWSASFGPFIWQGPRVIYHYHIWKLALFDERSLAKEFLYTFLLEKTAEIKEAGHGVSMVHMTKEKMEKIRVPLPPLAEQHRIVAKVDELMVLCDRMAAEQADAESAHITLVHSLLATLTRSPDAAELAASWQRLAEHFDTLFTTESSLDALKQTILQLAVKGKLVPQDPNDEPASELLKRIAKERARLEAEGTFKKSKSLPPVGVDDQPFAPPSGWEWTRFGSILSLEYGDNLPAPKRTNSGEFPVYGSNGVVGTHSQFCVKKPCIVVGRKGSAGALNLCLLGGCWVTDVAYYCIPPAETDLEFCFKLFHTLGFDELGKGIKPGLSRNEVYSIPIAIAPLAEQHRIVAKVDELMALCDRLKADLTESRTQQGRLATTLIESSLKAA